MIFLKIFQENDFYIIFNFFSKHTYNAFGSSARL